MMRRPAPSATATAGPDCLSGRYAESRVGSGTKPLNAQRRPRQRTGRDGQAGLF